VRPAAAGCSSSGRLSTMATTAAILAALASSMSAGAGGGLARCPQFRPSSAASATDQNVFWGQLASPRRLVDRPKSRR
jgi:hypothetical protein